MKEDQMNKIQEEEKIPGRAAFDWAEALVIALAVVILIFVFGVRLIGVSGSSMFPTLENGDKILVSHVMYTPEQGDIVVLTKESFMTEPIVKRVIATGGDTIDLDFENGIVYVNGEALQEDYINEVMTYECAGDMTYPQTVPEGCIFVMGDNRNGSSDSRVSTLGMVDTRYILGKVITRVLPIRNFGSVY